MSVHTLVNDSYMASNVYLIKTKFGNILIDTSTKKFIQKILKGIHENGLKYEEIDYIVITHCHFDHCESLYELKSKYLTNAKIVVHKNEANLLRSGDFKMPPGIFKISSFFSKIGNLFKSWMKYDPVEPDIIVDTSDYLLIFGVYIIHTPGHSNGSITVIFKNKAFVGDLMVNRWYNYWGYYSIYGDDLNLICEQWKKLITDYRIKTFYPGHGNKITLEELKKYL